MAEPPSNGDAASEDFLGGDRQPPRQRRVEIQVSEDFVDHPQPLLRNLPRLPRLSRNLQGKAVLRRGTPLNQANATVLWGLATQLSSRWLRSIWQKMAYHFWLPLLGLVAVGSAFMAPALWIGVFDLLIGITLLHARALQDWVQISSPVQGGALSWHKVEQFLAAASIIVSIVTIAFRVVENRYGRDTWLYDIVFVAVSCIGAACAMCVPRQTGLAPLGKVPASLVLVLSCSAATLAPAPSFASLPYVLLFLGLLASISRSSGIYPLHFSTRLCLLLLTTIHLGCLLGLAFYGPDSPKAVVAFFGKVGRMVITLQQDGAMFCYSSSASNDRNDELCDGRAPYFWPTCQLSALMLLHFVLTNLDAGRPANKSSRKRESSSDLGDQPTLQTDASSRSLVSRQSSSASQGQETSATLYSGANLFWPKRALRGAFIICMLSYSIAFPSLLTLPLLLLSFNAASLSTATPWRRVLRSFERSPPCSFSPGSLGQRLCSCIRFQSPEEKEAHPGVSGKQAVMGYTAFLFFVVYLFNVVSGGKLGLQAGLASDVPTEQGVWRDHQAWAPGIGFYDYGEPDNAAAFAFFPQALLLTCMTLLKVLLSRLNEGKLLADSRMLGLASELAQRFWANAISANAPELAIAASFCLCAALLGCHGGYSSGVIVVYVAVISLLLLSRTDRRGQPKLWLFLQLLSQFGTVLEVLIYVLGFPANTWPDRVIPRFTCLELVTRVAPNLALSAVAWGQRSRALELERLREARSRWAAEDTAASSVGAESPSLPPTPSSNDNSNSNNSNNRGFDFSSGAIFREPGSAWKRVKGWVEELLTLSVLVLALVTALIPPTDVHSLLLLATVGPALLLYNLEEQRERYLLKGLQAVRLLTTLLVFLRVVAASPLLPLPDDSTWAVSWIELGVSRPVADPPLKLVMLGITASAARLAMIALEAAKARAELTDTKEEEEGAQDPAAPEVPGSDLEHGQVGAGPGVAPVAGFQGAPSQASAEWLFGHESADEDEVLDEKAPVISPGTKELSEDSVAPEGIRPSLRPRVVQLDSDLMDDSNIDVEVTFTVHEELQLDGEQPCPPPLGLSTSRRTQSSQGSTSQDEVEGDPNSVRQSTEVKRRSSSQKWHWKKPRFEERLLRRGVARWMPVQAHCYLSALLLIVIFSTSISEVTMLNCLNVLVVISLCGWSQRWVQVGNVFSITTVFIMLLQYIARFKSVTAGRWIHLIGLEWSTRQVIGHCFILALCILQKQLWHRGRSSKPRHTVCPLWISHHADMFGFLVLLVVAVIRRHAWAPLIALGAAPWMIYEELRRNREQTSLTFESKKRWLRWFRVVLVLSLVGEVTYRLIRIFDTETWASSFYAKLCQDFWLPERHDECMNEWLSWLNATSETDSSNVLMIIEFCALFMLGCTQQLLDNVEKVSHRERPEQLHRKLMVMHWWPVSVLLTTFSLSLHGGTLLGASQLVLLFGIAFNSGASLEIRRRWVWRARMCAWVFLFVGLWMQSPVAPCSRAACTGGVHQVFMTGKECERLEGLDFAVSGTEASTRRCLAGDPEALGHDTPLTLTAQIIGLKRSRGRTLWDGLQALLWSQLGHLTLVIFTATVQLRIYSSETYARHLEKAFIQEPRRLIIVRARRYVHEFYCRLGLEETASLQRRRALRTKLRTTMRKISQILAGAASLSNRSNTRSIDDDMFLSPLRQDVELRQIAVEEMQISGGLSQEVAQKLFTMFGGHVELCKQYYHLLEEVTVGSLQPDGPLLELQVESLLRRLKKLELAKSLTAPQKQKQKEKEKQKLLEKLSTSRSKGSSIRAITSKTSSMVTQASSLSAGPNKAPPSFTDRQLDKAKSVLEDLRLWWDYFKRSQTLAKLMSDLAFVGVDELNFKLRSPAMAATEELAEHRFGNSPVRILWKLTLSNMLPIISVACSLAFLSNRSILDMIRLFLVFFVGLRRYPFPPSAFWTALKFYSAVLLLLRTAYDVPVLCAELQPRIWTKDSENPGLSWEPQQTFAWCPAPAMTRVGFDVILGVYKRSTADSLVPNTSWFAVVWADHLCLWAIVLHQWVLKRTGTADHVQFDRDLELPYLSELPEDGEESLAPGAEEQVEAGQDAHGGLGHSCTGVESITSLDDSVTPATGFRSQLLLVSDRVAETVPRAAKLAIDAAGQMKAQVGRLQALSIFSPDEVQERSQSFQALHVSLVDAAAKHRDNYIIEFVQTEQKAQQRLKETHAAASTQGSPGESLDDSEAVEETARLEEASFRSAGVDLPSAPGAESLEGDRAVQAPFLHHVAELKDASVSWVTNSLRSVLSSLTRHDTHTGFAEPLLSGRHLPLLVVRIRDAGDEDERRRRAGVRIYVAAIWWLAVRKRKMARIRCLKAHQLVKMTQDYSEEAEVVLCERCNRVVRQKSDANIVHWACHICAYHVCDDCVKAFLQADLVMGKQTSISQVDRRQRPGISLYLLKYSLGIALFTYALINNKAVVKQEERSFSESLQASSFSVPTLILVVLHLMLLIIDRIVLKAHYRFRDRSFQLTCMEFANLALLIAEFVALHVYVISLMANASNPLEARMSLFEDPQLCVYYVGLLLYFGVCLTQSKHGMPAVDREVLRPIAPPSNSGIIYEKIQYYGFVIHGLLPFVDDLRVIIDWTIVPTSLDLWMYFKVEDAHTMLYKTRHAMLTRRQSFFAEKRDGCEKIYNGWLLILIIIFVILFPIIIFSPISPFPNSVLIDGALLGLDMTVASSCVDVAQPVGSVCRRISVNVFESPVSQILEYNASRRKDYFQDFPRLNTDVDIEDVAWPWESKAAFDVSPSASEEITRLLEGAFHGGPPVTVAFHLRSRITRGLIGSAIRTSTACFCAPSDRCAKMGASPNDWPLGVVPCGLDPKRAEKGLNATRRWWRSFESLNSSLTGVSGGLQNFFGSGSSQNNSNNTDNTKNTNNNNNTNTTNNNSNNNAQRFADAHFLKLDDLWSTRVWLNANTMKDKASPQGIVLGLAPRYAARTVYEAEDRRWALLFLSSNNSNAQALQTTAELDRSVTVGSVLSGESAYSSAIGLYIAVVLVAGQYLRGAFQDSSKRTIYEEIPDVEVFLDLVTAVKLAREHKDLRTEFQLYYCLMKVLRSTNILLSHGGYEPSGYGVGRTDECLDENVEPRRIQDSNIPVVYRM